MITYRAAWVLPISRPPIRDGWLTAEEGRIVAVGSGTPAADGAREIDLGQVAVMPGLVNAHTHLELSYLHDQIPTAPSFTGWVRHILEARRRRTHLRDPEIMSAIDEAIDESLASGTAVVGDISNTLAPFEKLVQSRLAGVLFWEIIGFNVDKPDELVEHAVGELTALPATDRMRASLAAHAPYSVAPGLFQAIKKAMDRLPGVPCSAHVAEGAEEVDLLATGGGPWKALMKDIGAWNHAWTPPGVSPTQYLDELGFLGDRVLVVHGVQMSRADLERLKGRGATLVTCPRSNWHTGAGIPPVAAFYESGVRVAIGTDSLASAPDLNVFAELAALRAVAPEVPAARLLASATVEGARALGFADRYGVIEAGKSSRVLKIAVPSGTTDVEEYLVNGIDRSDLAWVE